MSDEQMPSYLNRNFNPSVEPLIAKYLEYKNRVELLCQEQLLPDGEKRDRTALSFCQDKLKEVETALFPKGLLGRRKVIAAWQLLHRVSEELILLMNREELYAFGLRLTHEVDTSGLPDGQKKDWSDRIAARLEAQSKPGSTSSAGSPSPEAETRHLFKNIYRTVNSMVDDSFWDLWVKKILALFYLILLILCMGWLTGLLLTSRTPGCLTLSIILLLGAVGGLASGLITGERESFPKGHFSIPILYYVFVRPTLGALTALVVFWAVESQFLVRIDPPLQKGVLICDTLGEEKKAEPPVAGPVSGTPNPQVVKDEKTSVEVSIVTLKSVEGKQHLLYMLILLFAGFSGDKVLKTIADKVTMKLIAQAEKTKEAT